MFFCLKLLLLLAPIYACASDDGDDADVKSFASAKSSMKSVDGDTSDAESYVSAHSRTVSLPGDDEGDVDTEQDDVNRRMAEFSADLPYTPGLEQHIIQEFQNQERQERLNHINIALEGIRENNLAFHAVRNSFTNGILCRSDQLSTYLDKYDTPFGCGLHALFRHGSERYASNSFLQSRNIGNATAFRNDHDLINVIHNAMGQVIQMQSLGQFQPNGQEFEMQVPNLIITARNSQNGAPVVNYTATSATVKFSSTGIPITAYPNP
jgi:hypothetical protein